MIYNNKKPLSFLKKWLLFSGLTLLMIMIATIFLEQFELLFSLSFLLIIALIFNRMLNFSFVRIQLENNYLIIRHYSLFAVERNYESVEFPVASLRHVTVKKYLFGLKWDLLLTVKLKQGLASYPPICLSAIPFADREKIVALIGSLVV
ncbi:MAG: hypothetical protein WCP08_03280 [Prolixibacteraceae bacterium]